MARGMRKRRERKTLNKALVLNTPHSESMISSPIFNYSCSPPLRTSLCLHKKAPFFVFCFCFEDKDIQPMGTLVSIDS